MRKTFIKFQLHMFFEKTVVQIETTFHEDKALVNQLPTPIYW